MTLDSSFLVSWAYKGREVACVLFTVKVMFK